MSSRKGFTLIEAVVAVLIGALLVVAIGGLSERLVHHRATTDSNSAAMSLAERQMEKLLADSNPTPTGGACPTADLCGNTTTPLGLAHGPSTMYADGTSGGPFSVQWWILDVNGAASSPLIIPTPVTGAASDDVKKITVKVTLPNNPLVNATVVRYRYKRAI